MADAIDDEDRDNPDNTPPPPEDTPEADVQGEPAEPTDQGAPAEPAEPGDRPQPEDAPLPAEEAETREEEGFGEPAPADAEPDAAEEPPAEAAADVDATADEEDHPSQDGKDESPPAGGEDGSEPAEGEDRSEDYGYDQYDEEDYYSDEYDYEQEAYGGDEDEYEEYEEEDDEEEEEDDDGEGGSKMTLVEHLDELRTRLIRAVLGLMVGMALTLIFGKQIIGFIQQPYVQISAEMFPDRAPEDVFTTPKVSEVFITYLKVSLYCGIVLTAPWLFYQMWMFVAAGLYKKEKRYVVIAVPFCAGLFIIGSLFFLLIVSKFILTFFVGFNLWMGVKTELFLTEYITFIVTMMLVFGLAFQTPVAVLLLAKIGLVTTKTLKHYRKHVIVGILIFVALTTSPSPLDQVLLAIPMWILYELGIVLAYFLVEKKRRQEEEAEAAAEAAEDDEYEYYDEDEEDYDGCEYEDEYEDGYEDEDEDEDEDQPERDHVTEGFGSTEEDEAQDDSAEATDAEESPDAEKPTDAEETPDAEKPTDAEETPDAEEPTEEDQPGDPQEEDEDPQRPATE